MMRKLLLIGVAVALVVAGAGSYQVRPAAADTDQRKCFQSGAGAAFTKICISTHGNISKFESPATKEHIAQGGIAEGYAICSNGGSTVHGYDAGFTESSWGASSFNATGPVVIRKTADGAFEIKQTYGFNGPEGEMRITMAVKNTSGSAKSNVVLSRYFDGDVDGTFTERGAISSASVFEWLEKPGHGLNLTSLSFGTKHDPFVETIGDFASTLAGCNPMAQTTPAGPADLTGRLNYYLGNIAAGATKTVVYRYARL